MAQIFPIISTSIATYGVSIVASCHLSLSLSNELLSRIVHSNMQHHHHHQQQQSAAKLVTCCGTSPPSLAANWRGTNQTIKTLQGQQNHHSHSRKGQNKKERTKGKTIYLVCILFLKTAEMAAILQNQQNAQEQGENRNLQNGPS